MLRRLARNGLMNQLAPVCAGRPTFSRTAPVLHARAFAALSKPSIEEARAMPKEFHEYSNDVLILMAVDGVYGACRERVVRDVMAVDNVSWDEAQATMGKIEAVIASSVVARIPYYTGIGSAFVGGIVSFPLVFHYNTVNWFNTAFVTADVPEPKDLETWLEVGSWSWNWMEPVLGQVSFALLAAQFVRAQMQNINIRPYGDWVRGAKAQGVVAAFPQYNRELLRDLAKNGDI